MAGSGYDWGEWADLTYNTGTDIDAIDVDDEATLTTDEIDMDGLASREISVKWVEGNDGACDGDVYVWLLAADGEGGWQAFGVDDLWSVGVIDAAQNTTKIINFRIQGSDIGSFKLVVDNDSGQDGDLTICSRTSTVPAPS